MRDFRTGRRPAGIPKTEHPDIRCLSKESGLDIPSPAAKETAPRLTSPYMLIALSYPVLVHVAVVMDEPRLTLVACLVLTGCVGFALGWRSPRIWVLVAGALGLVAIAVERTGTMELALELVVYLPPIAINLALLAAFGRSLTPGRVPLVTRFEALMNGPPDDEVRRYTLSVTQAWTAFFAIMTVECTLLALAAPPHLWSLFTNFINYLLVGLMFFIEYQIRLRVMPKRNHPSYLSFCRQLASVVPRAR